MTLSNATKVVRSRSALSFALQLFAVMTEFSAAFGFDVLDFARVVLDNGRRVDRCLATLEARERGSRRACFDDTIVFDVPVSLNPIR